MFRVRIVVVIGFLGSVASAEVVEPQERPVAAVIETAAGRVSGLLFGLYRTGVRFDDASGPVDHPWASVRTLRTEGSVTIAYGDGNRLVGRVRDVELGAWIRVDAAVIGEVRIPVASLPAPPALAQEVPEVEPTPLEATGWNGRVALGASLAAGNSDVFTSSLDALLQRDWTHDHLEFRLFAAYGTSEGQKNVDNQLLGTLWRHYYRPEFYSYLGVEAGRDDVQDVQLRLLANVGAGWTPWKVGDHRRLDLEAGLGYRMESFTGSEPTRYDLTFRGALVFKDVWFDDVRFTQTAEFIFPVTDPGAHLTRAESSLVVPIAGAWSFRTSLRLQYQGRPADDRRALDLLATIGLEYEF